MPLPKNYYTVAEALGLIHKRTMSLSFAKTGIFSWSVGPDDPEDPLTNLITALQDGQIRSWFVDETTGERVNLPPEVWWTVNQFGKSHLQFNATTGHVVMDLPSGGRGGGFLRIGKTAFDTLLSTSPAAGTDEVANQSAIEPSQHTEYVQPVVEDASLEPEAAYLNKPACEKFVRILDEGALRRKKSAFSFAWASKQIAAAVEVGASEEQISKVLRGKYDPARRLGVPDLDTHILIREQITQGYV